MTKKELLEILSQEGLDDDVKIYTEADHGQQPLPAGSSVLYSVDDPVYNGENMNWYAEDEIKDNIPDFGYVQAILIW